MALTFLNIAFSCVDSKWVMWKEAFHCLGDKGPL